MLREIAARFGFGREAPAPPVNEPENWPRVLRDIWQACGQKAKNRMDHVKLYLRMPLTVEDEAIIAECIRQELALVDIEARTTISAKDKSQLTSLVMDYQTPRFIKLATGFMASSSPGQADQPPIKAAGNYVKAAIAVGHEINDLYRDNQLPSTVQIRTALPLVVHKMNLAKEGA